jgi:hypothetical protein
MNPCTSAAIQILFLLLAAVPLYRSPDHALQVVVASARIEFQTSSGRILLTRDDPSHVILRAAWTADSQFFVASTESSEGHQPWAHPVWIYSRAKNQIIELAPLGATAVAGFTLKSRDVLQTRVLDCQHGKPGDLTSRTLQISLPQLLAGGRLPDPPCPAQ